MWAHPRSRGDHTCSAVHQLGCGGSSPLARGPLAEESLNFHGVGLIPARAGTTHLPERKSKMSRAHPRSRGDHASHRGSKPPGPGSSPLARGPPVEKVSKCPNNGLIPARAGTTPVYRAGGYARWAHPRSRGDHPPWDCLSIVTWGSSPLARGPQSAREVWSYEVGLIPARAGTTSHRTSWSR